MFAAGATPCVGGAGESAPTGRGTFVTTFRIVPAVDEHDLASVRAIGLATRRAWLPGWAWRRSNWQGTACLHRGRRAGRAVEGHRVCRAGCGPLPLDDPREDAAEMVIEMLFGEDEAWIGYRADLQPRGRHPLLAPLGRVISEPDQDPRGPLRPHPQNPHLDKPV